MAAYQFAQPQYSINYAPPDDFIPESEKGPLWFSNYARWIVRNFYNQQRQPFFGNDIVKMGFAEECIQNWSYVFGEQSNYKFKFLETDINGGTVPAVWIPGQKITELVNHMSGTLLGNIENIEIKAQNLSSDVSSKRSELLEKLMIQWELRDMMKQSMPEGVEFMPVNDPMAELETPEDIEEYVTKWQDEYSIIAERIAESQMYIDEMKQKFLAAGRNQFIGGLTGTLVEVVEGMVTNRIIPTYELIWDNRQDDDFNKEAMLCGYVKHDVPYQEVIAKFRDHLEPADIEEIRQLAITDSGDEVGKFMNFYNGGPICGNLRWWNNWGTSNMTVTYATVYFIAPRDWRYKNGNNRFGHDRIYRIKDEESSESAKATEPGGDYSGWDVHQATIIGNKFVVNYGYMPNTLRAYNKKSKPLLPIRIFCNNMALGYSKSIVSRLRKNQDELDRLAFKIQEMTAKAAGKGHIINGNKVPATSTEVMGDLKSIGVYVTAGSSGEPDDPQNAQRMIETVDMTLDSNIVQYINLRNEQKLEMEEIASVSRIALGQQQNTVGKGVQQNTINQNSYGTATLYWGLMKHFQDVLQYNVNLKQMLYQYKDTVEESLVIGDKGSFLLKILNPQEFGTQPLMVFLQISDSLDPNQKERIKSIGLADAQNGKLDLVDYIKHVELGKTPNQMIKGLQRSKEKALKSAQMQQAGMVQAEMQQEANMKKADILSEAALIQLKEDNANYRAELQALTKVVGDLQAQMAAEPPPSPLQAELAGSGQQ